jgi:hypothetical protein
MSMTDRENKDPSRDMPRTDTVDPIRQKLRSAKEEPMWEQSKTETAEAKRA